MKRVAIYARVSTNGQTVTNQLRELRQVAKRQGWKVGKFIDRGSAALRAERSAPSSISSAKPPPDVRLT